MPILTTSASLAVCALISRVFGAALRVWVVFVFAVFVDRAFTEGVFRAGVFRTAVFRAGDLLACVLVVRFDWVAALAVFFPTGFFATAFVVEARVVFVFVGVLAFALGEAVLFVRFVFAAVDDFVRALATLVARDFFAAAPF